MRNIREESFEDIVKKKDDKNHFVVFASKSCGPCHKVLGVFNDEAENREDATFNVIDVSQNRDVSRQFEIRYTPTILVFHDGEMIGQRRVGGASREVLVEYINRASNVQAGEKMRRSFKPPE